MNNCDSSSNVTTITTMRLPVKTSIEPRTFFWQENDKFTKKANNPMRTKCPILSLLGIETRKANFRPRSAKIIMIPAHKT